MTPSLMERQLLRARNGVAYYAGLSRPSVGQSPRDLVWERETARLWHYRSPGPTVSPPIVIVHSLISRSDILDLLPGSSMIGFLVDEGFDVFMLDWAPAQPADAANTLETYVDEYLPLALSSACTRAGVEDVTLVGYCLGGVLTLLYAAAHEHPGVRNLVTLTTPCAFGELGLMSRMFVEGRLDPGDVIDPTGLVPAAIMDSGFRLLKPTDELTQSVNVWEKLWDTRWLTGFAAINRWARDQLPFPGAAFREIVQTLIRDDALATGVVPLGARRVRLDQIACAHLNVFCRDDELVPPAAARPLADLVGSRDASELVLESGHVGLVAGSAARQAQPRIAEWIRARSDEHA